MTASSTRDIHRLLEQTTFVTSLARALAGDHAEDVAQGTWLRALEADPSAVRRPRQWLACIARRVARNLRRDQSRRAAHEAAAARPDLVPSSADLFDREERRREIVRAVDGLPDQLRSVVLLRYFEDLPFRAIADHLGIPPATAHSRLHTALATLRGQLDDRHGDRRAWLLPIVPRTAAAGMVTGTLAMTAKAKVLAAIATLVVAVLTLWSLGSPGVTPSPESGGPGQPPPLIAASPSDPEAPPEVVGRTEVFAPAPAPRPTTGALTVKAIHGEDGTPVPDLLVLAGKPGADPRFGRHRMRTDGQGIARFEGLAEGSVTVTNARSLASAGADIIAGADTEVELVLATGIQITGIVVDRFGVPVPGAEVLLGGLGALEDPERVATTGADGRFALRSSRRRCYVGARAAGHSASRMELVFLQEGDRRDLRIELPAPGGTVEGLVLGPDLVPVADAMVLIGPEREVRAGLHGRTGPDGRFRVVGIAPGRHAVQVRSARTAPWRGSCLVEADLVTPLEVRLDPGVNCTGVVLDVAGSAVEGAEIQVGNVFGFSHYRTRSAQDGTFRLEGLPPGEIEIRGPNRTSVTVRGHPGETVSCEIRLVTGPELRGRVLTEDDEPVAGASVDALIREARGLAWTGSTRTDSSGRFAVPRCPEGAVLTVSVRASGFDPFGIQGIDPRAGELLIRLKSVPPASARIVGTVVAPDGRPVPQAMVQAEGAHGHTSGLEAATDSGSFELGPLVPGTWSVSVQVPGQPRVWTEWRELGRDAVWELGEIWIPVPGTILVRSRSDEGLRPFLSIGDTTLSRWSAVEGNAGVRRSQPLAPGLHYVSVGGDGVARRLVPVEVRSGEETQVDIEIERGHRLQVRIEAPTVLSGLHLRVLRGDELVTGSSVVGQPPGLMSEYRVYWLAPGDYTMTANGNGLSGEARVTVREGEDDIVRVVLR